MFIQNLHGKYSLLSRKKAVYSWAISADTLPSGPAHRQSRFNLEEPARHSGVHGKTSG